MFDLRLYMAGQVSPAQNLHFPLFPLLFISLLSSLRHSSSALLALKKCMPTPVFFFFFYLSVCFPLLPLQHMDLGKNRKGLVERP